MFKQLFHAVGSRAPIQANELEYLRKFWNDFVDARRQPIFHKRKNIENYEGIYLDFLN